MTNKFELAIWVVIWVVALVLVARNQWVRGMPSVGLPFAYLLNLSIIHWFGGLIHTLPWHSTSDSYFIQLGFVESAYGVIAFAIGCLIVTPLLIKNFDFSWLNVPRQKPNLKLPETYIYTGLFLYIVLLPLLAGIPSFSQLAFLGSYLLILGLCLACWKAWYLKDKKAFVSWLATAGSLPLITIITMGFIGYGTAALSVVLLFVFSFYRPRWKSITALLLAIILGLSVCVTYLRDRSDIRAAVWGGKDTSTRIEQLGSTLSEFEFLDLHNKNHLYLIDVRLNQNILVGRAVQYLSNKNVNFAYGDTLWQAVIAVVPRVIWQDKPVFAGSPGIVSKYTGLTFARATSVGVGQVLEFYINFGTVGVLIGFVLFGVILRIIDLAASVRLIQGDWQGFTSYFLPGLGFMQPGGSLVEVASTTSAAVVLVFLLNKYYLSNSASKNLPVNENRPNSV